MIHYIAEFLIQFRQLLLIYCCVLLIYCLTGRICLDQELFDLIHDQSRIYRGRPYMLVDLMDRMCILLPCLTVRMHVMLIMIMPRRFFHSLYMLFFDCIHAVGHPQYQAVFVPHGA